MNKAVSRDRFDEQGCVTPGTLKENGVFSVEHYVHLLIPGHMIRFCQPDCHLIIFDQRDCLTRSCLINKAVSHDQVWSVRLVTWSGLINKAVSCDQVWSTRLCHMIGFDQLHSHDQLWSHRCVTWSYLINKAVSHDQVWSQRCVHDQMLSTRLCHVIRFDQQPDCVTWSELEQSLKHPGYCLANHCCYPTFKLTPHKALNSRAES